MRARMRFGLTGLDLVSELGFNSGEVSLGMCCGRVWFKLMLLVFWFQVVGLSLGVCWIWGF